MVRLEGQVKFFDRKKGFGFIVRSDGKRDVFLGQRELEASGVPTVNEGDLLSFELQEGKGKAWATNVKRV